MSDDRRRAPWPAEIAGGVVGSVVMLAVVLTIGLLGYAPLGQAAAPLGLAAAFVSVTVGGLVLAPVLYRWRTRSLTSLRGGTVLFAAVTVIFVGLGNDAFRVLAATALIAGAILAEVLLRRTPQHPSIAAR